MRAGRARGWELDSKRACRAHRSGYGVLGPPAGDRFLSWGRFWLAWWGGGRGGHRGQGAPVVTGRWELLLTCSCPASACAWCGQGLAADRQCV